MQLSPDYIILWENSGFIPVFIKKFVFFQKKKAAFNAASFRRRYFTMGYSKTKNIYKVLGGFTAIILSQPTP